METQAYIFSTTGEYNLGINNETLKEDILLKTSLLETGTLYAVPNPTEAVLKSAWAHIQEIVQGYKDLDHIGDDDYYDYFPDLINQYLQLAYQVSPKDYQEAKQQVLTDPYISTKYRDTDFEENPLEENSLDTPEQIQEYISDYLNNNYEELDY